MTSKYKNEINKIAIESIDACEIDVSEQLFKVNIRLYGDYISDSNYASFLLMKYELEDHKQPYFIMRFKRTLYYEKAYQLLRKLITCIPVDS